MKEYINDLIPRIQRFSQKLDNLALLTNQHWVLLDEIENNKKTYIFKKDNELIVSNNGDVIKGKWEFLGNKSLLIDLKDNSYLLKHAFFDANLLALKKDSKEEYVVFLNENKYNGEINSQKEVKDFLNIKYAAIQSADLANEVLSIAINDKESLGIKINQQGKNVKSEDWLLFILILLFFLLLAYFLLL
ncbi:MAG: hypothetical protein ACOVOF_10290 [Chryseotalea sp.]|jgi:hypothetical protein|nr:hypothetical protein [Cytophagales bacterium]